MSKRVAGWLGLGSTLLGVCLACSATSTPGNSVGNPNGGTGNIITGNAGTGNTIFVPGQVTEWLDCGNKDATVFTNQRYLEYLKERGENLVAESATITNSVLIEPVYIGENAVITNSVVGPHVSIGSKSNVRDSRVSNSIVQTSATILNAAITDSMIGNFASVSSKANDLSVGDYNVLKV